MLYDAQVISILSLFINYCEKFSKLLAILKIMCYNIFMDNYIVFFRGSDHVNYSKYMIREGR